MHIGKQLSGVDLSFLKNVGKKYLILPLVLIGIVVVIYYNIIQFDSLDHVINNKERFKSKSLNSMTVEGLYKKKEGLTYQKRKEDFGGEVEYTSPGEDTRMYENKKHTDGVFLGDRFEPSEQKDEDVKEPFGYGKNYIRLPRKEGFDSDLGRMRTATVPKNANYAVYA